jgi:type I restriction enzyme S subunit
MNPDQLIKHFDRISEAPGAISKLRRFILDLAIRGKLVKQDANEEPASVLLARIRKEKTQILSNGGTLKKDKTTPGLPNGDRPFSIPESWQWSQLATVGILNPRNMADDDREASFVPMPMIPAQYGVASTHEIRHWGEIKSGYTHFAEGDVALAKITPCFQNGKSTVFRGLKGSIGSGTTELHVVRPILINPDYILVFLKSPSFIESGTSKMTGTAGQKRVPTEYFATSPFPVPPLSEQQRIVAKIDELMALCDQLAKAKEQRDNRRKALVAASLHYLNNGTNADAFPKHASFYINHLPTLTARIECVQSLRQTILNLAVLGKLVPQVAGEEPASELMSQIRTKRATLVKAGVITQKRQTAPAVKEPVNTLHTWEIVSFGDLCNLITSGSRGWAEFYAKDGPKFIRAQNIRFGRLLLNDLACVTPPSKAEGLRTQVSKGDILIVITGAGVTNPAILENEIGEAYVSQHVALVKLTDIEVSRWLLLCLMAPSGGRSQLVESAYGAGKPGLNLDNIRSLTVPVPPLAEQRRILAKVAELMALCDRLEAQLSVTQTENAHMLEAILLTTLQNMSSARTPALAVTT